MKSGLEQLVEWYDNRPQHIKGSIYFDERFIRKARAYLNGLDDKGEVK